jgi:hypothetical protein
VSPLQLTLQLLNANLWIRPAQRYMLRKEASFPPYRNTPFSFMPPEFCDASSSVVRPASGPFR